MARKTVKVDQDVYEKVVEHTQSTDGKIGKFYDRAAKEKLEREQKKEKVEYNENLSRVNPGDDTIAKMSAKALANNL